MTAEDRERALEEMRSNAHWRDEQRKTNVRRLETEERAEEEERKAVEQRRRDSEGGGEGAAEFIRPMLSAAAAGGTVEERIRSNVYKIQRGYDTMSSSFVKR